VELNEDTDPIYETPEKKIPGKIANLKNLQEFYCNDNKISYFPKTMQNLSLMIGSNTQ